MKQIIVFFIFGLFLLSAKNFAEESRPNLIISKILNHSEVQIEAYGQRLKVDEKLTMISKENGEVLGHVQVQEVQTVNYPEDINHLQSARARIVVHSKNSIPMVGDLLDKIDLSNESDHYPGRGDLLVFSGEEFGDQEKNISVRYRPLVDQGLFIGETASTLARNENFISLSSKYAYGLTNRLSLSTFVGLDLAEVYNINAKYNLFRNEDFLVTPTVGVSQWSNEEHKSNLVFGMFVDILTNSKLISHTAITWSVQGKFFGKKDPTQSYLTTSSIQSGYEYILDNWSRFLLGPRYYFETQSVGGYLAYMMIWDHFHLEVGVNSMNLTKFKFGDNGLLPVLDLIWRF